MKENNYFDDRTIKSELGFDDILIKPSFTSIEPIDIDLSTKLTRKIKLKIPIISTPMSNITESDMALALANEGGLGVIHRYMTIEDQINQIKKVKSNDKITAASVGVNDKERAIKISKYTDVLFIETTSASNKKIFNFVKDLTKQISCDVVVGNFGTSSNIEEYCDLGISGIKVGVGVGSICTLQKITGVGRPQISALIDIFNTVRKYKMPVIADGGIRSTGDIVKALAAGADSVMIGYILSGTKETPGKIVKKENKKYKEYNGTLYSFVEIEKDYLETDFKNNFRVEGISTLVPYKGPVKTIINIIGKNLKAAFGLIGAKNIQELHEKVEFIQVNKIPGIDVTKDIRVTKHNFLTF